ncbi:trans-aconitate 2-methyltransferase [Novosphingobium sp.]|uniref:class I SAM-dependent methyltransferase n=1 Tax=Novosphingobium sp. TaxID=1874826 RepID=UPI0027325F17|nr:class I SAM-dependent methyltransferase [Novosphingobium sp.]MDP3905610.1 class I SAM-dependent methyltransferase [Novosphingobium sp.]
MVLDPQRSPLVRILRRAAQQVPGALALGRLVRRTLDPQLREIHRLQHQDAARLLQPFPDTFEERYPQLFDALAQRLAHLPAPRILSFGCSSGAEVRALRRRLPSARIVGLDLNRRMIADARIADTSPLSDYRLADAPNPDEQFDAVLAMAVLRHGVLEAERPDSCAAVLPFARFADTIARLDRHIVPGGWLALYHAHFRFRDTATAARYQADPLRMSDCPPQTLLYGPDDRLLTGMAEPAVLFHKQGSAASD